MAEVQDFNVIDNNNTARWPENMPFANVNNAGRADEGILARWLADSNGSITASGSPNAFTITSSRTIAALFNNLVMAFTANFTITGPSTLNLNGLGAKTIKRYNGSDVAAGDIISGQPLIVVYKSSPDLWFMMTAPAALVTNAFADFSENAGAGTPAADVARLFAVDEAGVTNLAFRDAGAVVSGLRNATQTDMETATSVLRTVTPGVQKHHPAHPKAWGYVNGATGALFAGFGVSTSRTGVGLYHVAFTTPMSGNYAVMGSVVRSDFQTKTLMWVLVDVNGFDIRVANGASAAEDNNFSFSAFGDI